MRIHQERILRFDDRTDGNADAARSSRSSHPASISSSAYPQSRRSNIRRRHKRIVPVSSSSCVHAGNNHQLNNESYFGDDRTGPAPQRQRRRQRTTGAAAAGLWDVGGRMVAVTTNVLLLLFLLVLSATAATVFAYQILPPTIRRSSSSTSPPLLCASSSRSFATASTVITAATVVEDSPPLPLSLWTKKKKNNKRKSTTLVADLSSYESSSYSPSMFLSSSSSSSSSTLSSSIIKDHISAPKLRITTNTPFPSIDGMSRTVTVHRRRNRGVLGFQILRDNDEIFAADTTKTENNKASSSSSSSQLEAAASSSSSSSHDTSVSPPPPGVSRVDSNMWNWPEPLVSSSSPPNSSSKKTTSNNSIPWIPNRTEIEGLTVVLLKRELGARGLKKTGNKAELQQRLLDWSHDQTNRRRRNQLLLLGGSTGNNAGLSDLNLRQAYGSHSTRNENESCSTTTAEPPASAEASRPIIHPNKKTNQQQRRQQQKEGALTANSLAEWARTLDLEPLLRRRQTIHKEKLQGKNSSKLTKKPSAAVLPSDYLDILQKVFDKPSSKYSNREVKQMYQAAKHADQMGDVELSIRILEELQIATPQDARIVRRLARMEKERGNVGAAKSILRDGIKLHPDNAFLWHGLGQLMEWGSAEQKECWAKAIQVDPTVPHSYHALGTLEHTQGRIAKATKILKQGIVYCPTNHRIHHALGDLYRDAKMLEMAKLSYHKALKYAPSKVNHGFSYTALAYVEYEQKNVENCRLLLHRAIHNHSRYSNGWIALSQMEESEGNIDAARSACVKGIAQYERGLLKRQLKRQHKQRDSRLRGDDFVAAKNALFRTVPKYRSGDRFFQVYRNWMRLEERYGTVESFEGVYQRALVAFSDEWKMSVDAAQYYVRLGRYAQARDEFTRACNRVGKRHADPFRLFAEFEMSQNEYPAARQILYSGALTLTEEELDEERHRGLAELFLTWAVCEWQMDNDFHAGKLFEHALDLATVGRETSTLRAYILYAMARFEFHRGEHQRAQHFVGLCLKENLLPGGNPQVWDLWASIAEEMGNAKLALQCKEYSLQLQQNDRDDSLSALSRLLKSPTTSAQAAADLKQLMRRDPWHHKIFGHGNGTSRPLIPQDLFPRQDRLLLDPTATDGSDV